MTNEIVDQFTKSITQLVNNNIPHQATPSIGYITNTNANRRYAEIQLTTDGMGKLSNIPCIGIPVIGDTVTIIYIKGNYEQPIALCPRSLPVPEEVIQDYYTKEAFNYLDNGDFHNKGAGYVGEFTIDEETPLENTNTNSIILEPEQQIQFQVNLNPCNSTYFKFQCYYRGMGELTIHLQDTETEETINTLPYSLQAETAIWTSNGGRWAWSWNKETYPLTDNNSKKHNNITFTITNTTTSPEDEELFNPTAMMISALLVYDENNDKNYYNSLNDKLEMI